MYIPDHLIMGLHQSTRAVVIYRNGDGSFRSGFVMRVGEFIANVETFNELVAATSAPKRSNDDE
ncbi:TPA: hypothetical protein R5X29_000734 [Enterobacter sichuanensis]|nr:hypothetical protein [Enterobacter sichuanensis]